MNKCNTCGQTVNAPEAKSQGEHESTLRLKIKELEGQLRQERHESLVRDLARNLREAREHLWIAQMVMGAETRALVREVCEQYDAVLARVPKELLP